MEKSPTIILTADETMMSKYRGGIFLGFSTCSPRGIMPDWLYFAAFAPPVPRENGRVVIDYSSGCRIGKQIEVAAIGALPEISSILGSMGLSQT